MTEDRRAFDPFAPPPLATASEPAPATTQAEDLPADLRYLSKPELVTLAEQRNLDPSGTRPELIDRLLASQG
jgi:hypothetical protein